LEGGIIIRTLQKFLARVPVLYRAILLVLGRGSVEKRLYLSLIRKGNTVFDIGANQGYFTILFSDLVGPSGRVHAFEPVPSTFARLSEAVQVAGCDNVTMNQLALGEIEKTASIFVPGDDGGQAAFVRHQHGSWEKADVQECAVEVARLDDYANGVSRIDFIKCDVEGAELLVLEGGANVLQRCRPILFLENDDRWMLDFGWSSSNVLQLLQEIGYTHFYSVGAVVEPLQQASGGGEALLCGFEEIRGVSAR